MATTQENTHGPKWLNRIIKNPVPLLAILGLIYFAFALFASVVKSVTLMALVSVGLYTAFWFIFSPNAPKWFKVKTKK